MKILRDTGWPRATRRFGSGAQGGGDVSEGPADTHFEIKNHARCTIHEWIAQAEREARPTDLPVVAFRKPRGGWYACVPLDELLALIRLRETA